MTSKEECLDLIDDVRCTIGCECIHASILNEIYEYLDEIEKFINQQSNPTLSECIKEWEEKGFIVNNQFKDYQYYTISSGYFDMEDIFIYISLNSVNEFYYSLEGHLNIELNELLAKTLKALEVEE